MTESSRARDALKPPMTPEKPLILVFAADLMFGSKIAAAAAHLDFRVEQIGRIQDIAPEIIQVESNDPGEPVHGHDALVFAQLVERQPALIIVDLQNEATAWRKWVALLKSSPATRRMPIVAYAPHVDADLRRAARGHGIDLVTSRGKFSEDLPRILQKFARIPDYDALRASCSEPLDELAVKGLILFNEGAYYECHEELELAWKADQGVGRDLYRGILQVGVAYLQIVRGNYNGAVKMLLRVKQWLDPFPERCRGVDIGRLRRDAAAVYEHLLALGSDRIDDFDRRLLRPVHFESSPGSDRMD